MRTIDVIHNWNDLEKFGVIMLTGESCGYAMRLLCDLTEKGKLLIEKFLGGTVSIKPDSNWNGGKKDDPHVGSVLLSRDVFSDLAAFALLQTYPNAWVCKRDGGFYAGMGEVPRNYADLRWYRRLNEVSTSRNTHAFSGRTE